MRRLERTLLGKVIVFILIQIFTAVEKCWNGCLKVWRIKYTNLIKCEIEWLSMREQDISCVKFVLLHCWMLLLKSGSEATLGQIFSVGVPRTRKILKSWSISEPPENKTLHVVILAKMQQIDHVFSYICYSKCFAVFLVFHSFPLLHPIKLFNKLKLSDIDRLWFNHYDGIKKNPVKFLWFMDDFLDVLNVILFINSKHSLVVKP